MESRRRQLPCHLPVDDHRDLRELALQTYTDLFAVLVMALMLLVPPMPGSL